MWTVMWRGYPSFDEDVCWDEEYNYFDTQAEAEKFASVLEDSYSERNCTSDHPWYKSKFYAWEIGEEYIRSNRYKWALWKASTVQKGEQK